MVFFPPDFELLTALKKFRLDRVNTVSNVKSTVPGLNTLAFRNGEKKVFAGFCQKNKTINLQSLPPSFSQM